jgi:hypothetical protein
MESKAVANLLVRWFVSARLITITEERKWLQRVNKLRLPDDVIP